MAKQACQMEYRFLRIVVDIDLTPLMPNTENNQLVWLILLVGKIFSMLPIFSILRFSALKNAILPYMEGVNLVYSQY